ncbi:MAG TPA: addiction module protein [Thermoanaerobaculia bacterium]
MTEAARKILEEALNLDADERASLAAELLASLQEREQDVEKAWAAEIERRSRNAADERGTDWRVAFEEIRADVLRR